MARAHRHYLPGQIWHLTHRCHQRQFLLQFHHDRQVWMGWLYEARKRLGLCVVDYMATSNHVHLLVDDRKGGEVIPVSMQLVAGRVGQEYNRRKGRGGAFREDRYHATAVESGEHFRQCLAYIDLNMVRAGVVTHPEQWLECGYVEIQHPQARYGIIDYERLMELMGVRRLDQLQQACREQIEEALQRKQLERQSHWSESLAVGSPAFVETVRKQLGARARGRDVIASEPGCQLRENEAAYGDDLQGENSRLSLKNTRFWDLFSYLKAS
ncbi:MAG: transposase [Acidobacteriia bacterium]|nr:transposase [Terriglobia bacterium]